MYFLVTALLWFLSGPCSRVEPLLGPQLGPQLCSAVSGLFPSSTLNGTRVSPGLSSVDLHMLLVRCRRVR